MNEILFRGAIYFCLLASTNLFHWRPVLSQSQRLREIAILDLSDRNGESDSETFSVEHVVHVAGIPFIKTDDVKHATAYVMVVTSSRFKSSTLYADEKERLTNYVVSGGILVTPNATDPDLYPLLGLSGYRFERARYIMDWQGESNDPTLYWLDDSLEQTISLGRPSYVDVISTRGYAVDQATPLAFFDDGSVAIAKNEYGTGLAYTLGFSFKDMILRNQLNRDYDAERSFSNGFEPTSDTIILFLRGIYEAHVPFAVWKHTSPYKSQATLMITHDVDSQSGMDMMNDFADLENQHGVTATYNITTHYIDDFNDGDYYTPNIPLLRRLLEKNQKIGSHSVGHFLDFGDEERFPEGSAGNTRESYSPYYDGVSTFGGTVYGELEVSKNLLENDLGAVPRTFRTGHLTFNRKQINVLDELGYQYDSSFSANDVLTNFPYICHYDRSFNGGVSNIYEIPMTISDAGKLPITAENWPTRVDLWLSIIAKNAANHAPTVLLIHPNREFKLLAEERLLRNVPDEILIMDMDTFGEYWRRREALTYETSLTDRALTITLSEKSMPLDPRLSLIVNKGDLLSEVIVQTDNGQPVLHQASEWTNSSLLLYDFHVSDTPTAVADPPQFGEDYALLQNYPNPFNPSTTI
ncbi:hypothetical protein MJD09_00395, partial [bacterium]|nr:hypothetical protein [bacterium]